MFKWSVNILQEDKLNRNLKIQIITKHYSWHFKIAKTDERMKKQVVGNRTWYKLSGKIHECVARVF